MPKYSLANALRFLSIDAVQKANSGHPGMPMGMADIAEVLWRSFLKHNPNNPKWENRDRFVLSNGHGSMLLYALLHLTGYDITIEDLKKFRQLGSKTPGHPEFGLTDGVETTTGPLGQGLANAVGMALAEKMLASQFNRHGHDIVDHYTYVFLGDGCLMEGISHEACSLAGTHHLGKLIAFWDNNSISIDGNTEGWFTENIPQRFEAYGWHVVSEVDGHNPEDIHKAILNARFVKDRPSLICCRTILAYGAPTLNNSHKAHGAPLGATEIDATRKNLHWEYPPFVIPEEIYAEWNVSQRGKVLEEHWQGIFAEYAKEYPDLATEFKRRTAGNLPQKWDNIKSEHLKKLISQHEDVATRKASQECLQFYGAFLPEFVGGSADLTESNGTMWPGCNYIHYGVREFGMFAIMNGLALHGGFLPYGGTFLIFIDYGINAIRLAALMQQRVIYVLTHDSIGLGEDGPTHQPIEQLTTLRTIPRLSLWRPCDTIETAIAWQYAIENTGPTCIVLTRQKVKRQKDTSRNITNIGYGGYILLDCPATPQAIIIATGSEVEIAITAAQELTNHGYQIRVISMPSTDVFDKQTTEYKETIIPQKVKVKVAIEAGHSTFWHKYVGERGIILGINDFGKSAPYEDLYNFFDITAQKLIDALILQIKNCE